MRRKIIAISIFLTLTMNITAIAQNRNRISGTVSDKKEKYPLIAVSILIEELKTGTYSDNDGNFKIPNIPDGKYTLRFSLVGHKSKTITISLPADASNKISIELEDGSVDLHEIVVTGNPFSSLKGEISQSTLTMSALDLEIKKGVNLGETLNFQPGVSARSNGTATYRPVIRGFSNNRILILENGLRMGDLSNSSDDHSVSSDGINAEKIELVRGPASLLYGSNAIGGVVNVITQSIPTEVPDGIHGNLEFQGASGSRQVAGSGDFHGGFGRFAFHTNILSRKAGEYRDGNNNTVYNSSFKNSAFQGGLSYIPYNETYGLSFTTFESEYGIPVNIAQGDGGVLINMKKNELKGLIENQDAGSIITSYSLKAGFQNYEHQEKGKITGITGTSFGIKTVSADLSLIHAPLFKGAKGIAGISFLTQNYTVSGEEAFTPNADYLSLAAYLFEQFKLEPFTIQTGARYEFNSVQFPQATISGKDFQGGEKNINIVSVSLGAIYNISESISLFSNGATAFRAPTIEELSSYAIHDATGSFDIGSRDLTRENNTGLDLGFRVNKSNHSVELSAYYNNVSNYIYKSPAGLVYNQETNTFSAGGSGFPVYKYMQANAEIYGFEAKAEYELKQGLTTKVIFDYTRGILSNGENLPQMPPMRFSIEQRFSTDYIWTGFNFKLTGGQFLTAPDEKGSAGYGILDLYAGFRVVSSGFIHSVTLTVDNALNQPYRDHLSAIKEFALMPGRNIKAVYKILF